MASNSLLCNVAFGFLNTHLRPVDIFLVFNLQMPAFLIKCLGKLIHSSDRPKSMRDYCLCRQLSGWYLGRLGNWRLGRLGSLSD